MNPNEIKIDGCTCVTCGGTGIVCNRVYVSGVDQLSTWTRTDVFSREICKECGGTGLIVLDEKRGSYGNKSLRTF